MENIKMQLKLLIKLLYRILLNQWQNKNKIHLIFTYLITIFFVFQILSTSGQLADLLKDTPRAILFNYLTYFFNFLFILWIISPLFFGYKLSFTIDINQFKYLPIKSHVFVIANLILGNLGIGPLIIIGFVFAILFENFYLSITSFFLTTLLILLFINIAETTSFLINNYTLNQRYPRSKLFQIAIWILLILGFLFIIYMKEDNLVRYLYIFLPSVQVVSVIKGILGDSISIMIFPLLGLCLYFIASNYYVFLYLKRGYNNHRKNKKVKRIDQFQRSYFKIIENLIKMMILNSRLRMIVTKEILYFTKNNRLIIWYLIQLIFAYIFFTHIINDLSNPFVITIIVASLMGVLNLNLYINLFAFDSNAVQNYYVWPIFFKDVFLSKNLANIIVSLVLWFIVILIGQLNSEIDFSCLQLVVLFCFFLYSNIIAQSFGNILSIYFAMKIPFNQSFGLFNPFSSIIISMVVMVVTLVPSILFSIMNISEVFMIEIGFILLFISFYVYIICLNYASKKSLEKRMIILNEIC